MENKFNLSVSFSLHNGAVVLESSSSAVKIGITDIENKNLIKKLRKSVSKYFLSLGKEEGEYSCDFLSIDSDRLEHEISLRYGESSRSLNRENEESEAQMLLNTLLKEASDKGATDLHIEERRVRFRISSILEDVCELSPEKSRELIRRVKVLANLNVLDFRHGQDGNFVFQGEDEIFVRVSSIPALSSSNDAESMVLRLLNVTRVPLSLLDLGFTREQQSALKKILEKDQGLILISGATGSGKSTTAASLLMELEKIYGESKKIIAIEDPPEYVLDGVTQIHVDEENGMSFSQALRFIFRQDPDVIFIGEIRDSATAKTVLQASLTGHLVLATVHTSGIEETSIRMKELGVDFNEFSSVLQALIFQKLIPEEKKLKLKAQLMTFEKHENLKLEEKKGEKFLLQPKKQALSFYGKTV
ncbi:MAG: Flp pilus assembly complex ATPase component TadA [Treponema sp.]|nr:Flp pilus assembly complex ATPase component TadA [Treponema sp.]